MEILNYRIDTEEELAFAGLSCIKEGGLFIKTALPYTLDTLVTVTLKLLGDPLAVTFL